MGRVFGPEDEALQTRAVQLRRDGATLQEIKAGLRVGSSRLARWLADEPVPARSGRSERWSDRRRRAHELRAQGCSYREIQAELRVPKSTLSSWLRDVPLSDEHRARLAQRSEDGIRSRAVAIRASRIRRTEVLQETAAAEIGALTDREVFLLGVVAYWCEGSKAKPWAPSTRMSFINSDATLLRLHLRWLEMLGIERSDLVFTISIHERADVEAATTFWADVVGVDRSAFRRPNFKRHNPRSNRHNTGTAYVGCLTIKVRRSVDLNRRIEGWWRGIAAAVGDPYDGRRSAVV